MEKQENAVTEGILDSRHIELSAPGAEDASSRIFGGSELPRNFIDKLPDFPNVVPLAPARTDDKTFPGRPPR